MSEKIGNMVVDMNVSTNNMFHLPAFKVPEMETIEFNAESMAEHYVLHEMSHDVGLPIGDIKMGLEIWGSLFAGFLAKPVPVFNIDPKSFSNPTKAFMPGAK